MNCADAELELLRLAYGEPVDPAVEAHPRECPRCAEALAELRDLRAAVAANRVDRMPTALPGRVRATLWRRRGAWAAAAAAAMLIATFAVRMPRPEPPPPAAGAAVVDYDAQIEESLRRLNDRLLVLRTPVDPGRADFAFDAIRDRLERLQSSLNDSGGFP
jgi:hypothetical protein